jgi:hypothetical protein
LLGVVACLSPGVGEAAAGGRAAATRVALRVLAPGRQAALPFAALSVFATNRPLPAGAVIGLADQAQPLAREADPTWLFWEDLGRGMLFPHGSQLLLVDARTDRVLLSKGLTTYPLVNGHPPDFLRSASGYNSARGAIYNRNVPDPHANARSIPHQESPPGSGAPAQDLSSEAIVLFGDDADDAAVRGNQAAVRSFAKRLKEAAGVPSAEASPANAKGLLAAIQSVISKKRTDVLLFINGHGRPLHDYSSGGRIIPGSKIPRVEINATDELTSVGLTRDLERIHKDHPDIRFKVIIASCFAGRWLEVTKALPNVSVTVASSPADKPSYQGFLIPFTEQLANWAFGSAVAGSPIDVAAEVQAAAGAQPVQNYAGPDVPWHPSAQFGPGYTPAKPKLTCVGSEFKLFDNSNIDAVDNGGTPPTFSTAGKSYCLASVITYHWNDGDGAAPGKLSLVSAAGTLGPWQATAVIGSPSETYPNGVPDASWEVTLQTTPAPVIIDGTYTCNDSDPSTWSQNAESGGLGFCRVWVYATQPG